MSTQTEWGRDQRTAAQQESPFRAILPGLVALVIMLGIFLSLKIFFGVLGAIREPAEFQPVLDQWEEVVKGRSPLILQPVDIQVTSTSEGASIEITEPHEPTAAQISGSVRVNYERPLAVFILLFLLLILVRIALGIVSVGVKMVVASPYKDVMNRLITELRRRPPPA
jgi:hypothetical protein